MLVQAAGSPAGDFRRLQLARQISSAPSYRKQQTPPHARRFQSAAQFCCRFGISVTWVDLTTACFKTDERP